MNEVGLGNTSAAASIAAAAELDLEHIRHDQSRSEYSCAGVRSRKIVDEGDGGSTVCKSVRGPADGLVVGHPFAVPSEQVVRPPEKNGQRTEMAAKSAAAEVVYGKVAVLLMRHH